MYVMAVVYLGLRGYSHQRRSFYSAADISKSHTFKWGPLADEVLDASRSSPSGKNAEYCGQVTRLT